MTTFYVHNGTRTPPARHASPAEVQKYLAAMREEANEERERTKAAHTIYAAQRKDPSGAVSQVDIFRPAFMLTERKYLKVKERLERKNYIVLSD